MAGGLLSCPVSLAPQTANRIGLLPVHCTLVVEGPARRVDEEETEDWRVRQARCSRQQCRLSMLLEEGVLFLVFLLRTSLDFILHAHSCSHAATVLLPLVSNHPLVTPVSQLQVATVKIYNARQSTVPFLFLHRPGLPSAVTSSSDPPVPQLPPPGFPSSIVRSYSRLTPLLVRPPGLSPQARTASAHHSKHLPLQLRRAQERLTERRGRRAGETLSPVPFSYWHTGSTAPPIGSASTGTSYLKPLKKP
ncbi:hypothetical protein DPEC_G00361730 [Dallia pectoralis]|nr:hypothetical protein DPEC_G00361730 [Dallia pectoralis]